MASRTFAEIFSQYLMWIPICFVMFSYYLKNVTSKFTVRDALIVLLISIIPFCNMILVGLMFFAIGEILGKRLIQRYAHVLDKEIL